MTYSATTSLTIRATPERVWQALTDPAIVKKYFFGTDMDTQWKVGSPIFFRGEWEDKTYEDKGTVLSFEPPRSLSYNYWSSFSGTEDTPEARQIIRFDLDGQPEGVRVTVNQSNVDTQERANHSLENWRSVLDSMKKLLEGSA